MIFLIFRNYMMDREARSSLAGSRCSGTYFRHRGRVHGRVLTPCSTLHKLRYVLLTLPLLRQLIHLIATSPVALRTANPNAAGHAWDGPWSARKLSADAAISTKRHKWKLAAEGSREQQPQPRSIPTVSLSVKDLSRAVAIVLCPSTRSLARSVL